jgi:precorrin-6B methylase 2
MGRPLSYADNVVRWLRERLDREPSLAEPRELALALRVLALWRASVIVDAFVTRHGRKVLQGPFAGMAYVEGATEGALAPRLLGTYEAELHPYLTALAAEGLDHVIDVGAAEGYYAVGMALLAPGAQVHAFDISPKARAACAEMAALNGVGDRVTIGETVKPEDFEVLAGPRRLVLMDVEGAEEELLRPDLSPALAHTHIIVEAHEVYRPGVAARLTERFAPTHRVIQLAMGGRSLPLPDWLMASNHLDQLLAVWEWRLGPTPWLVMRPKSLNA